jgi:hypothetical protein
MRLLGDHWVSGVGAEAAAPSRIREEEIRLPLSLAGGELPPRV